MDNNINNEIYSFNNIEYKISISPQGDKISIIQLINVNNSSKYENEISLDQLQQKDLRFNIIEDNDDLIQTIKENIKLNKLEVVEFENYCEMNLKVSNKELKIQLSKIKEDLAEYVKSQNRYIYILTQNLK